MKIAITGAAGFLGWHARCALRARGEDEVVPITRDDWTPGRLGELVAGTDLVLHLAGANRAEPEELREGNAALARDLTAALDSGAATPTVVYANSIHAGDGTPFGDGKAVAAEHLLAWGRAAGAPVVDVRVPNLFGEHGRPLYNSVVATFCHLLATGGTPEIDQDRELPLLHAQDAVDQMLGLAAAAMGCSTTTLPGAPMTVSAVLALLQRFAALYATGDIPPLPDPLHLALFNTYRSFTFPAQFPIRPQLRADNRGHLFECVRAHGGQSQVFCSTSHPGITRGEHFHRRKVERFQVLSGRAEIALRRLFDAEIVRFEVSGEKPAIVDMPTMWAHSITNIGDSELMTLFWAHEVLDPANPDTYAEPVAATVTAVAHG